MKKLLVTISFLLTLTISGYCQADTISYWHVYLDNKLINEFSVTTDNPKVEISTPDLNKSSILTVEYFRDTPCQNCRIYLAICNSEDDIIFKIKGSGTLNMLNLKLKRLVDLFSKTKDSTFILYYKEPPYHNQFLFTLTFKK